jgi:1-acyl-sn-glycerol-3-phosphate acyltransferase
VLRRVVNGAYAVAAALVLTVVTFFVCIVVIAGPTLAIRRELGRLGVRIMLASIGVPLFVRGRENLPSGPCVVVANHASYLDGLVMTAALPRQFSFVVQDGAANWPIVGLTLKRMGVIFVNRASAHQSAQLTRQLMRRLHNGEPIAIFPEGTFKPEPGIMRFKDGAFLIAARTAAPVVPVGIRGTRRLYGGGRQLLRWSVVHVEFGAATMPAGSEREAALALRDTARAAVVALSGEPDRAVASADAPA